MSLTLRTLLTLAAAGLSANTLAGEDDLAALMALLQQETELATQTRMNADYVPGSVSVLYAEDAIRAGKQTVADMLAEVAGVYVSDTNDGEKRTIVRGVGATQNANNLKLLVNGLEANRPTDGSADWVFRLPLSMVDRIEVIRGPGSSLYGGFAFSGVVNVIPRADTVAGAAAGNRDSRALNASYQGQWGNGINAQLTLSGWRQGNSGLQSEEDVFAARYDHPTGDVYDHHQGLALLSRFDWQGYQLSWQMASTEMGPGYGYASALPDEYRPRVERATMLALEKQWQLADSLTFGSRLGYQSTGLNQAAYIPVPKGVVPPGGTQPLVNDVYRGTGNEDRGYHWKSHLTWQASDQHLLYSELGISHLRVMSAYNYRSINQQTPIYGERDRNTVLPGSSRTISSLALQDQWQASEQLAVTAGVRYDHFSDWGHHVSPRLATVWQLSDAHILKLQYAEAFRPPSLQEDNPGSNSTNAGDASSLHEETLRSWEAAWVYRGESERVGLTLFRTRVDDLIEFYIYPGRQPIWRNRGNIMTAGAELEWQQQLNRAFEWRGNVSYSNAKDYLDPDYRLLGAVDWMAHMSSLWHLNDNLSWSLSSHFVGQQEGWETSGQVAHERRYPAYWLFDTGLEWRRVLAVDPLKLVLACQNLTDREYRTVPSPSQFPDGLPHGRRQLTVAMSYDF
ncbi:TonB-dependent receptor plug domain-containing protein [Oceanobacter mangrovi]|uniref:TonB-dependent receptor plug domain-containing protein n=1 Tax=Oceanobacter mangrovi TaxID=2862510 RepID=UPI001C8DF585|nr:TonB-dependent receptor [Oceanobacter mangrovi]